MHTFALRLRISHRLLPCQLRTLVAQKRPNCSKSVAKRLFNTQEFLDSAGVARKVAEFKEKETIFSQGDPCRNVFYIQTGGVRLSVVNESGKEAVVAVLGPGDFFGEVRIQTLSPPREQDPRIQNTDERVCTISLHDGCSIRHTIRTICGRSGSSKGFSQVESAVSTNKSRM